MAKSNQAEQQYRAITAQAWTVMLVMPIASCVTDLWQLAIQGSDQTARPNDPLLGIWFFTIATGASALLAVAIRIVDSPPFRRLVFSASGLYLAALILIQSIDVALQVPWSGFHIILVVTHDTLALLACWASRRWLHLAPAGTPANPPMDSSDSGGERRPILPSQL